MPFGERGRSGGKNEAEGEGGEAKPVDALFGGGAQGDKQAGEGATDVIEAVTECDLALAFHRTHQFARCVFGEGPANGVREMECGAALGPGSGGAV